ncbi:MAG: DUF1015 domain-containing protein [Proteobacteria bacterium]|nr:DUF1015 domain-containing protein [Pseudomonadota bacterium]
MPLIRPFAGLRPNNAIDVIAPPYDVLNTEEARLRVEGRPWSFLHISKPEIDLPTGTDPFSEAVYAKGKENLQKMFADNILTQDAKSCYYLYKITMGEHNQIGLVAASNVTDYNNNRIRKHEFTRPDKEDDRVNQIDALNAQTGPVFLTYKHHQVIDELVNILSKQSPTVQVTADDGVIHTLWVVDDSKHIETITTTFENMNCLYIADGHHRSAAASRVAIKRQTNNPQHTGEEAYNYFLSVIFPDNQVKILDYNRVIRDLNDLSSEQFLEQLTNSFTIKLSDNAVKPQTSGEFGMYLDKKWYKLVINPDKISSDPVANLDVSLLTDNLFSPILNITDLRRDKRIDFIGGIRGLSELEKRVDSGEMRIAFSLYPTSMQQLMAVADAERVMPPKSTWFEPKLADGIVSHLL